MWIENHSNSVPRRKRGWIVYLVFWIILFVSLAVSVYLGLTSSYAWYLERTSYRMYEAMLLSGLILLAFLIMAVQIRNKRLKKREESLRARVAMFKRKEWNEAYVSRILNDIEEIEMRRKSSWISVSALVLMILILIFISVSALAGLSTFLAEDYEINTIFVLFTGSCSKTVVGLESVVLYKLIVS